jgi:DNA primase
MNSPGLDHYRRLFGQQQQIRGRLDRASLPSPISYLTERGLLCKRPRAEWVSIRCPKHKGGDERHPSMSVSLVDGHFACHACGAKGGDIVALHQLVTGLGFRDAVRDLGGRFHE